MVKITIEVDGAAATMPSPAAAHAPVTPATATASECGPPHEVLAQAAASGAINAGAGPSGKDLAYASAPIASSVGGTQEAPHTAASAGPAPQHVFQN